MRDLSLHLLDIIQNSISAEADRIIVTLYTDDDVGELVITVSDNGKGMDEAFLKRVTDPFTTSRTTRKVGLGIPLLKHSAEMSSGDLEIKSAKGKGTDIKATFKIDHIDRPPLGDIAETMMGVILTSPEVWFQLEMRSSKGEFEFDTLEVKEKLGDVPITEYEVISWIRDYIYEGVKVIFGGVFNEIDS